MTKKVTLVEDLRSWIGFPKKELDELLERAADKLDQARTLLAPLAEHDPAIREWLK